MHFWQNTKNKFRNLKCEDVCYQGASRCQSLQSMNAFARCASYRSSNRPSHWLSSRAQCRSTRWSTLPSLDQLGSRPQTMQMTSNQLHPHAGRSGQQWHHPNLALLRPKRKPQEHQNPQERFPEAPSPECSGTFPRDSSVVSQTWIVSRIETNASNI